MPCRTHWLQLQQYRSELDSLGVRVFIVTFDELEIAKAYVDTNHLGWPLLLDTDRSVYRSFGMGRASWWTLVNPVSIWNYLKLWMKGARPQQVGSDMHQLGGDVLIDPAGEIRLLYVSMSPHDRPSIESLLKIVRDGSRS
ncbi:MAG: AhpC/TSA family protein [Verrucomicrobiales bacterium]